MDSKADLGEGERPRFRSITSEDNVLVVKPTRRHINCSIRATGSHIKRRLTLIPPLACLALFERELHLRAIDHFSTRYSTCLLNCKSEHSVGAQDVMPELLDSRDLGIVGGCGDHSGSALQ
jgi:hypothetical protein